MSKDIVPRNTLSWLTHWRYLYNTTSSVFSILSATSQAKVRLSITIIDRLAYWVMLFIFQLMHNACSVRQLKNKWHSISRQDENVMWGFPAVHGNSMQKFSRRSRFDVVTSSSRRRCSRWCRLSALDGDLLRTLPAAGEVFSRCFPAINEIEFSCDDFQLRFDSSVMTSTSG